jgi:homoserine kinase type II
MSVYTRVSPAALEDWLRDYPVGALQDLQPIAAGIENSNYFVTTAAGRFVLTLFEKLQPAELPFYLGLMAHLAGRGIPCPQPIADRHGRIFAMLCGKPATLVTRLPGQDVQAPTTAQCAAVGTMLARMHLAAGDYPSSMPNPRGLTWWRGAALEVVPHMPAAESGLLQAELNHQSRARHGDLPQGPIHADLFRDNVLFTGDAIGGVIDFYFACNDRLLYDVAITVNDWCIEADGALDPARAGALLSAYRDLRPFAASELGAWNDVLRAGALRFWVSRLYDFHCPRPGELTFAKDPAHFRRILQARIAQPVALGALLAR